ncbi:type III secretion system export apparatus subunit SctT [uncultured Ralstonia sp.]|jgi:type III secretion protein T|uniref:type III secretion system export apparatus subunit SctT n=1 Tax=Ralstonia sp. TaxID=54061 RepID=UPI001EA5836D|nr:type III secretion system export apparatus subunit SctT [uncultured Ralstonia sp.]UCF22887.1 MAG: type III secretion system export apparatus subunit SctT [Ralstonia sp.]
MQGYDSAAMEGLFRQALLVLPRLLPILFMVPVFSGRVVTGMVRSGLIAILAVFVAPAMEGTALTVQGGGLWMALALKEALIGVLLGMAFGALLWALENIGHLIDFQTGSGNASFFDPVAGHESGATASFLGFLAITLFVTGGGLHVMLGAFFESYALWPVERMLPSAQAALEQFAVHEADSVMSWTVKLAAPVIIVLVVAEAGIGLINRAVPQLNVFLFAQPVKSLLAVLMMVLFLGFVFESLKTFLSSNGEMVWLLRALLHSPAS